jgi:hypothetical protein
MRRVLLLACVAACDSTFSLVHLDDPVPLDGDIVDGRSPCWNTEQLADEDSDGAKDGCDLCPADPMAALADMDSDLIDDICDPHPTMAIDDLVDFDGFTLQRTWMEQSGTWTIDTVAGTMSTTTNTAIVTTELGVNPTTEPTLDVVLTGDSGIGIYVKVGAGPQLVGCEHVMGSSPTPDRLVLTNNGVQVVAQDFDVGNGPARMRLQVFDDGNVQCNLARGGAPGTIGTTVPLATSTTATGIGLMSRNGNTMFKSVTLFGKSS